MATITPLPETTAQLRQLDRREWSRLAASLIVIVLLTAALAGVTPTRVENFIEHPEVEITLNGLWGVILLFAVFAIYQQIIIARLRRQVESQIAVAATMELLERPTAEVKQGWSITRRHPRYDLKCRITVTPHNGTASHGHTTDVSEGGFAAILPDTFAPGTQVMVEMNLGEENGLVMMPAVVRHRRGYYHGLELVDVTPSMGSRLRQACQGRPVLEARSPMDPAVPAEATLLTEGGSVPTRRAD